MLYWDLDIYILPNIQCFDPSIGLSYAYPLIHLFLIPTAITYNRNTYYLSRAMPCFVFFHPWPIKLYFYTSKTWEALLYICNGGYSYFLRAVSEWFTKFSWFFTCWFFIFLCLLFGLLIYLFFLELLQLLLKAWTISLLHQFAWIDAAIYSGCRTSFIS